MKGNHKKDEDVRSKKIEIRVTELEKKQIELNAGNAGFGLSEYGRQIMLKGQVFQKLKSISTSTEEQVQNLDRRTLLGLANNLNQLTRYAHQTRMLPQVEELLSKIEQIIEK
jgi:repressor of nif and glnA expression